MSPLNYSKFNVGCRYGGGPIKSTLPGGRGGEDGALICFFIEVNFFTIGKIK